MFRSKPKSSATATKSGTFSRRIALAAGLTAPFMVQSAQAESTMETVVDRLLVRAERQAQLFNAGEMDRWLELIELGDEFTLMQPFGGPASHGFDASPENLAALAANFRNGDARLELVQAVASDDVVVLAYVERQDGEVHGLPNQDWSLRVTQVFQRQGSAWKLVHRHADPLVRQISLTQTAALAAGRDLAEVQAGED